MSENIKFFPFEEYIHSCDEKEYGRDVRKMSHVIKYVNLLMVDNYDIISLRRLATNLIFFRNTFTKDSFLTFFLMQFKEEEKNLLAEVVFDMFIRTNRGEFGERKRFFELSLELYKYINYENNVWENWKKIKNELLSVV